MVSSKVELVDVAFFYSEIKNYPGKTGGWKTFFPKLKVASR